MKMKELITAKQLMCEEVHEGGRDNLGERERIRAKCVVYAEGKTR